MQLKVHHILQAAEHAMRAVSFVMLLKGMVAGSLTLLAIAGVAVPYLGLPLTPVHEGAAVGLGAIIGAVLAVKA